jgi:hypothetical protein
MEPLESRSIEDQDCATEPELCLSELWAEGKAELVNPAPGRIKRFAGWFYDRFVRFHGSPRQIAWGIALGIFVAMSPTMGIQMAIVIPLAAFFRISKLAAAAAVWVTNPATAPVIYWLNYKVGASLLGYPVTEGFLSHPSWETFWHAGSHTVCSLTLGGLITGFIMALPAYFVSLTMIQTAREKARLLREKRRGR